MKLELPKYRNIVLVIILALLAVIANYRLELGPCGLILEPSQIPIVTKNTVTGRDFEVAR